MSGNQDQTQGLKPFTLTRLDPTNGKVMEIHTVFNAYKQKGTWYFTRENGEKGFAWGVNCWKVEPKN